MEKQEFEIYLNDQFSPYINQAKENLKKFKDKVEDVQEDIKKFRNKVSGYFEDVADAVEDLTDKKQDLKKFKSNVKEVQGDLKKFKKKACGYFDDVADAVEDLTDKKKDLKDFQESVKKTKKGLKSLSKEAKKRMKSASKSVKGFKEDASDAFENFKENACDAFKSVKKAAQDFKESTKEAAEAPTSKLKELAGSIFTLDNLKNAMSACVSKAREQQASERNLAAAFRLSGKASKDQLTGLKNHAKQLEKTGVITSDVTMAFQGQMAAYDLSASSIKSLSSGANDLIAHIGGMNASQEDAAEASEIMGAAMNGNLEGLEEAGLKFDQAQAKALKYGSEQEKVAAMTAILKSNVGGVNAELANSDEGKITKAKNSWASYQATIGEMLMPLLGKLADWFTRNMPMLEEFTGGLMDAFSEGLDIIMPLLEGIMEWIPKAFKSEAVQAIIGVVERLKDAALWLLDVFVKIVEFFVNNWSTIAPIMMPLIGILAAWAMYQGIINVLMNANPIGLVIMGIIALIAVIALVCEHWETIKLRVSEAWDQFKTFITGITEEIPIVGTVIESIITTIEEQFEFVKGIFAGVIDFVKSAFAGDWEAAWQSIIDIFANVFGLIGATAAAPLNAVIELINNVIDGINGFSFKVPDWVPGDLSGRSLSLDIPHIPRLQLGSAYTLGGMYEINDGPHGGEIVNLPNGSQVIPGDKTNALLRGQDVNVYVTVQGNVIGNEEFANELGEKMVSNVRLALSNM